MVGSLRVAQFIACKLPFLAELNLFLEKNMCELFVCLQSRAIRSPTLLAQSIRKFVLNSLSNARAYSQFPRKSIQFFSEKICNKTMKPGQLDVSIEIFRIS